MYAAMSKDDIQVLMYQKREYVDHLKDVTIEAFVITIRNIYEKVLQRTANKNVLQSFQDELTTIPEWNASQIHENYKDFIVQSRCNYFPDLLKAVFMTYGRLHIATVGNTDKLQLRVPNAENFVHRCYISIARSLWKRPYLMYHELKNVERQRNLVVLEELIGKNISMVIRSCLPMTNMVSHIISDSYKQEGGSVSQRNLVSLETQESTSSRQSEQDVVEENGNDDENDENDEDTEEYNTDNSYETDGAYKEEDDDEDDDDDDEDDDDDDEESGSSTDDEKETEADIEPETESETEEQTEEPVVEPVVEEPVEEPVEEQVEVPVVEPVQEQVEEPVVEPVQEPVEEPVEEPLIEPIEEPVQEQVQEPTVEPVEQVVEEKIENNRKIIMPKKHAQLQKPKQRRHKTDAFF